MIDKTFNTIKATSSNKERLTMDLESKLLKTIRESKHFQTSLTLLKKRIKWITYIPKGFSAGAKFPSAGTSVLHTTTIIEDTNETITPFQINLLKDLDCVELNSSIQSTNPTGSSAGAKFSSAGTSVLHTTTIIEDNNETTTPIQINLFKKDLDCEKLNSSSVSSSSIQSTNPTGNSSSQIITPTASSFLNDSIVYDDFLSKANDPTKNSAYIMGLDYCITLETIENKKRKLESVIIDTITTNITLQNATNETINMLKLLYVPSKLSDNTREKEFQVMYDHVNNALSKNQGITIYAGGLRGSGKTFAVQRVVQQISDSWDHDKFLVINISGNTLTFDKDLQWIYKMIGNRLDLVEAHTVFMKLKQNDFMQLKTIVLNNLRGKSSSVTEVFSRMIILVIDDMHMVDFRVLKTLINISNEQNSKLIIIGTGNDVQLMSGIFQLTDSTQSNYKLVIFEEYKNYQLMQIMKDRIVGNIVHERAIQFIAAKLLRRISGF